MIKQSSTYTFTFLMVLTSDHLSPATGKTVTVKLSKAGGTFAAAGGTVTEISDGWYKCALTTTDTNTLGDLAINCTATACDPTDVREQIALIDPITGGIVSVSGAVGSVTGAVASVIGNVGGSVASVTGAVGSVTGNVGGTVASVSGAVGSVTGNVGGSIGGSVAGSVASVTAGVTVSTNNDKTGYGLSAAAVFAIWDALTSTLTTVGSVGALVVANLNATVSSRLSSAGYTAAPTANQNADALLDRADGIETGWTFRQAVRIILAALGGKLSGAATSTAVIRNVTDSKSRITATVDADGNRSAVTYDLT